VSQFRTTADLVLSVLRRCGEVPNSNSPYYQQAIDYLNQINHTVITGGNEFNIDVDEPWVWARARRPLILELQPAYTTGSVTIAQGSNTGTFSTAPTFSVEGWFLRLNNGPELYKIAQHTASSVNFSLDAAFPQTSVTGQVFSCFKLDYELNGTYVVIDAQNDSLDFIVSGTTVLTATIPHGSYTPADLATAAAAALQAADGARTYTGSYDSLLRYYSITSNLAAAAVFKPQGAGPNSYRSAWDTLGFDYLNYSSAAIQTSTYPHSSVIRLVEPARCYYSNLLVYSDQTNNIAGCDPLAFDRDFPLNYVRQGVPTNFCVIREKNNATLTVRFNRYPDKKMRVEFEHVPTPKDLQNNSASVPLLPRKFIRALEYGACFYLLTDKRDDKAQAYFQIAQVTLQSMIKFNRKELEKIGRNFGYVIARPDLTDKGKYRRPNLYGYDSGSL
jgi:hypothetical protein